MLQLAVDTKAGGGTSPVKSLLPFYESKEVVKTFIMVTDEEENGTHQNMRSVLFTNSWIVLEKRSTQLAKCRSCNGEFQKG